MGLDILEHHVFRVTRTRDLEIDEDVTEDLMQSLERELLRRRFEPAVRLEVEESISADVLEKLVTELAIDRRAVYHLPGPLDLTGLNAIADLDLRRLKYPAFVPRESALPQDSDVFATLDRGDVLVHHPYDSFTATVERLTVEAAADPRVLAIKQTLYRTSDSSPIVDALIDAAEAGKQVVVVRGAEGALRRAGQHHLGPQAGGSGLPRRLRRRRHEDALQDGARRAGGAGRVAAPLLPYRHRELQPVDRPALRGLRAAHLRRDGRR